MSDIIYKYGPFIDDKLDFRGEPVHVGCQIIDRDYQVYIWCRVPLEERRLGNNRVAQIVATGEEYTGKYIGTVVMPSGLVWHVVEH